MSKFWGGVAFALAAGAAMGLAGEPATAADAPAAGAVTYAKDVAPILNKNCAVCHRAGQIGPMVLTSYNEARPWAKAIKRSVTERTMPPWFANPEHGKWANDPRLSEQEIAVIAKWADTGAPMGEAADLPPVPEFIDDQWLIGKPDAVFTMEPFTVTDDMEDHYEYVSIKNHLTEDKWIKAVEIRPGFKAAVHHNLVFLGPPDAKPWEVERNLDLFAKWGPGNNPDIYPVQHGKLLPAGCQIVFQMHYHKEPGPGTGGVDQSSMAVLFHDGPVENPVTTAWILEPRLNIPPGATDYKAESVFRFIDDGNIFNLAPHAHLRGKKFQYIAEYPDGKSEILLDVPNYDFNWQISYHFAEPKKVPRGTKIRVVAKYDNSANNPANPDPTRTVTWGEATTDEMMIGFMDYTYDKKKKFQRTFALPEGIAAEGNFFGPGDGDGPGSRERRGGDARKQDAPKQEGGAGGQ